MRKKQIKVRKWLNKAGYHTTANVYLNMYEEKYSDDEFFIAGHCDISDCFKKVTLQLGADTKGEARNTLYKIDTLMEVLEKAREFVIERMDELKGR